MVEEHWIEDLEEFDSSSEQSTAQPRTRRPRPRFDRGKIPYYLLGGGALLLLLIILAGLLGGNDEQGSRARLEELSASLNQLEERLSDLEAKQEELLQRLSDLEPEYTFDTLFENLNTLSNELETVEKGLRSDLAALQEKIASREQVPSGGSGSEPPEQAPAKPASSGRVHVVEQGDNLFRIGLQYDVSPKQIRQWNDLGPEEPIYPGQELIVSPQGGPQ